MKKRQSKMADITSESEFEDIVRALTEDHNDLRKLGEVLKSDDYSISEKKEAFKEFQELLKSHSKSEEKAVYDRCMDIDELKQEAEEGYVEHSLAEQLMKKIPTTRNPDKWCALAKVLAEIVEHHAEEEEKVLLPQIERQFEEEEQKEMTQQFIKLREKSQPKMTQDNGGILAQLEYQQASEANI